MRRFSVSSLFACFANSKKKICYQGFTQGDFAVEGNQPTWNVAEASH